MLPGFIKCWNDAVKDRPDQLVLISSTELGQTKSYTYKDLDDCARRFAAYLSRCCPITVKSPDLILEPIIAIYCERSQPYWVISLLAAWGAGYAVLLLDSNLSPDEIDAQMKNCGCQAVVVDNSNAARKFTVLPVIDWSQVKTEIENIVPQVLVSPKPEHLAYIVYSSGTTGMPKAIAIEHRGIMAPAEAFNRLHTVNQPRKLLQIAKFRVDACFVEFSSMAYGVCLVLPPPGSDPLIRLAEWSGKHEVNMAIVTPSMLNRNLLQPEDVPGWEVILVEGASASRELLEPWFKRREGLPRRQILLGYGSSEETAGNSTGIYDGKLVDLGDPMKGCKQYILGENVDIPQDLKKEEYYGTLAVHTEGLARGYVREGRICEESTNAKFTEISVGGEPVRVHLTGDCVSREENGKLIYRGRKDRRYKIAEICCHGSAIEERLASVLRELNIQFDKVVVYRVWANKETQSISHLEAVIIINGNTRPSIEVSQIYQGMRDHDITTPLPSVAIPSRIFYMDIDKLRVDLKGPNIKNDKLSFEFEEQGHTWEKTLLELPDSILLLTELEKKIAGIWAEVLHCPLSKINDPSLQFEDLGGHSLKWQTVLKKVEAHPDIKVRLVNSYPNYITPGKALTLRRFAKDIARRIAFANIFEEINNGRENEVYCFHPISGSPTEFKNLFDHTFAQWRFIGIRSPFIREAENRAVSICASSITEEDNDFYRCKTMKKIAAYTVYGLFEYQRINQLPAGPYRLCGYSYGGIYALATAECLQKLGCEISWLGLLDPPLPSTLRQGLSGVNRVLESLEKVVNLITKQVLNPGNRQDRSITFDFAREIREDLSPKEKFKQFFEALFEALAIANIITAFLGYKPEEKQSNVNLLESIFRAIENNATALLGYEREREILNNNSVYLYQTAGHGYPESDTPAVDVRWDEYFDSPITTSPYNNTSHISLLRSKTLKDDVHRDLKESEKSYEKKHTRNPAVLAFKTYYSQFNKLPTLFSGEDEPFLTLDDNYVQLSLVNEAPQGSKLNPPETNLPEKKDDQYFHCQRQAVMLEDIFKPAKDTQGFLSTTKKVERILLLGSAGQGKSTLLRQLAYIGNQRAKSHMLPWLREYDVVLYLPLRYLRKYIKVYGDKSTEVKYIAECVKVILAEVCPITKGGQRLVIDIDLNSLSYLIDEDQKGSPKILWLLDGYDEIDKVTSDSTILKVLLQRPRVILSSRPCIIPPEDKNYYARVIEVTGFDSTQIETYIAAHFQKMPDGGKKQQALLECLDSSPNMSSLAQVPINLRILCKLIAGDQKPCFEEIKNLNKAQLYEKIIIFLRTRAIVRPYGQLLKVQEPDNEKADYEEVLTLLAELAFLSFKENKTQIEGKQFEEALLKLSPTAKSETEREAVRKRFFNFGVLKKWIGVERVISEGDIQNKYHAGEFIHLTFQEFFTARYIVQDLKKETQDNFNKKYQDYKYDQRYLMVWSFVAGLVCNQPDLRDKFVQFIDTNSIDLTGRLHLPLIIYCAEEMGENVPKEWMDNIREFSNTLCKTYNFKETHEPIVRAFKASVRITRKIFEDSVLRQLSLDSNIPWVLIEAFGPALSTPAILEQLHKKLDDRDNSINILESFYALGQNAYKYLSGKFDSVKNLIRFIECFSYPLLPFLPQDEYSKSNILMANLLSQIISQDNFLEFNDLHNHKYKHIRLIFLDALLLLKNKLPTDFMRTFLCSYEIENEFEVEKIAKILSLYDINLECPIMIDESKICYRLGILGCDEIRASFVKANVFRKETHLDKIKEKLSNPDRNVQALGVIMLWLLGPDVLDEDNLNDLVRVMKSQNNEDFCSLRAVVVTICGMSPQIFQNEQLLCSLIDAMYCDTEQIWTRHTSGVGTQFMLGFGGSVFDVILLLFTEANTSVFSPKIQMKLMEYLENENKFKVLLTVYFLSVIKNNLSDDFIKKITPHLETICGKLTIEKYDASGDDLPIYFSRLGMLALLMAQAKFNLEQTSLAYIKSILQKLSDPRTENRKKIPYYFDFFSRYESYLCNYGLLHHSDIYFAYTQVDAHAELKDDDPSLLELWHKCEINQKRRSRARPFDGDYFKQLLTPKRCTNYFEDFFRNVNSIDTLKLEVTREIFRAMPWLTIIATRESPDIIRITIKNGDMEFFSKPMPIILENYRFFVSVR